MHIINYVIVSLLMQPDLARIIVFAARRTGSSLLIASLRAHPLVLMHGELFHVRDLSDEDDGYVGSGEQPGEDIVGVRRREPLKMLRFVESHAGRNHRAVGLKVFRDHLHRRNWPVLTDWCTVCVILRREDVAAQYRSLVIARRTGRWKGRTKPSVSNGVVNETLQSDVSITDAYAFRAWLGNQQAWYHAVDGQLRQRSNVNIVRLSYERDLNHHGGPNLTGIWSALNFGMP